MVSLKPHNGPLRLGRSEVPESETRKEAEPGTG